MPVNLKANHDWILALLNSFSFQFNIDTEW